MLRAVVAILLVFAQCQVTSAAECTRADGAAAEAATNNLDTWSKIYGFYKRYHQCYDASVAEGAADKIEQLWDRHWDKLHEMIELTSKDQTFKTFLWQRLDDEVFPLESHWRVVDHATSQCPPEAQEFCAAVIASSKRVPPNKALERSRGG